MEFTREGAAVHPMILPQDTLQELEYRLVLCYTGIRRRSDEIIDRQMQGYLAREGSIMQVLDEIKVLAVRMKESLLAKDLDAFGHLLHRSWMQKKRLNCGITNKRIDSIYKVGMKNGALGGKILGAGGGGYLLFYCRSLEKVKLMNSLRASRTYPEPVNFVWDGCRVWEG